MVEKEDFEVELDFWGIPYPERITPVTRPRLEDLINLPLYQVEISYFKDSTNIFNSLRNLIHIITNVWKDNRNMGFSPMHRDLETSTYKGILLSVKTLELEIPATIVGEKVDYTYLERTKTSSKTYAYQNSQGQTVVKIIHFEF